MFNTSCELGLGDFHHCFVISQPEREDLIQRPPTPQKNKSNEKQQTGKWDTVYKITPYFVLFDVFGSITLVTQRYYRFYKYLELVYFSIFILISVCFSNFVCVFLPFLSFLCLYIFFSFKFDCFRTLVKLIENEKYFLGN